MIVETIITSIMEFILFNINLLPSIAVDIPVGVLNGFSYLLYGVGWFLPMEGLLPILAISALTIAFRIYIAFLKFGIEVVGAIT